MSYLHYHGAHVQLSLSCSKADWLTSDHLITVLHADWLTNDHLITLLHADWLTSDHLINLLDAYWGYWLTKRETVP